MPDTSQVMQFETRRERGGFALVIALSLMAFIVILLLSMATMLSVEVHHEVNLRESMKARQNAQLGLMVAIGELQKYAGKDQVSTARADIISREEIPNPYWTGVWTSTDTTNQPHWIVSGNQGRDPTEQNYLTPHTNLPDPTDQNDMVWILQNGVSDPSERVKVQAVNISEGEGPAGRYAYWVADEGIKVKFNIASEANTEEVSQTASPMTLSYQFGVNQIDAVFSNQGLEENSKTGIADSLPDLALLTGDSGIHKDYFHDLTTDSFGLLTDGKNGGFKKDLSLAFEDDAIYEREFGENESDPKRYFIDGLEDPETGLTGPNWDILRSYYMLYDQVSGGSIDIQEPGHTLQTSLRNDYEPYAHGQITDVVDGNPTVCVDNYHHNNVLSPTLSRMRVSFRLRTLPSSTEPGMYNIILDMIPAFGLYNPYNVALNDRVYAIYCKLDPTIEIQVGGDTYTKKLSDMYGSMGYDFYGFVLNTKRKTEGDGSNFTSFMPGETRLFMPMVRDTEKELKQQNTVQWLQNTHSGQALYANMSTSGRIGKVDGSTNIRISRISIGEDVFLNLLNTTRDYNGTYLVNWRFTALQRIQSLWQSSGSNSVAEFNEPMPWRMASSLTYGEPVATWEFNMQTSRSQYGLRMGIDNNLRPMVGAPRWDGSQNGDGNTMMAGFEYQGDHGLLEQSESDFQVHTNEDRYNGYWGNGIGAGGAVYVPLFDIPREPLLSIGAMQHANLGRYSSDPSYIIGNSYANPRISLDSTVEENFAGITNMDVYDLSYLVNEKLWDSYFFSSIDPNLDSDDLKAHLDQQLYRNKRYLFASNADQYIAAAKEEADGYQALASRMMVNGAFNINSTSVNAWKAVLSSMHDLTIPVFDPVTNVATDTESNIFFSRLTSPHGGAFKSDDSYSAEGNANFWAGFHELSEEQITDLAEGIVDELKARGRPFGVMADFVNRDPGGSDAEQRSGILQRVIDEKVNGEIALDYSDPVNQMTEGANPFEVKDLSGMQATAAPGYLLQGDVLQALAPILTARSDTFIIRAYGEARNPLTNELTSVACCEAVVQRIADPLEGDVNENANRIEPAGELGRRFEIVKFRWLSPEEI